MNNLKVMLKADNAMRDVYTGCFTDNVFLASFSVLLNLISRQLASVQSLSHGELVYWVKPLTSSSIFRVISSNAT